MRHAIKIALTTSAMALCMGIGAGGALAQTDPGQVQQQTQEQLRRAEQEKSLLNAKTAAPQITVQGQNIDTSGASDVKNIYVSVFEVDPSSILSPAEIDAVLAPYRGHMVSLKDLFAAVAGLNRLYDAKGVKTSRAILPGQDVKDGVVRIRLVEARVEAVRVVGAKHIRESFITDRIHVTPGELLSVSQLEADLVRFNSIYETSLGADITAGASLGKTVIGLNVTEPKRQTLTLFFDNAGRDTVGEERGGLIYRINNLAGRSDALQAVAVATEGSHSYGLSYALPVAYNDLRLDVSYNTGDISVISGPFQPLDISGDSRELSVGLTQPFGITATRQWSSYVRYSNRNSVSAFGGVTQDDVTNNVLSIGITREAHFDKTAWSFDSSFNLGRPDEGTGGFAYYRANLSRIDRLPGRAQLLTRAALQYAFRTALPSSEQFQAGGTYSVRGYGEGLLAGRDGFAVSAELRFALNAPDDKHNPWATQALIFIDHGGAVPYRPSNPGAHKDDFLTSVGAGFTADYDHRVSAKLIFAYPLDVNPAAPHTHSVQVMAGLTVPLF